MAQSTLLRSTLPGIAPAHSGKVRDMYDLQTEYLMVTTDRLSAFDVVFPTPIPGKGRVLTALSVYWFETLGGILPNHLLGPASRDFLEGLTRDAEALTGRSLRVKKCQPIKAECIVRGSLEGSGWKEYQRRGAIQEHSLPPGLRLHDRLPEPLFTPSTKAEEGHDENITFARMQDIIGRQLAETLRESSLRLFIAARDRLEQVGITLADTKFEFGLLDGEVLLIDEVLTPDSSRFLIPGTNGEPVSMDKQFVRDWAERTDWDKKAPAPPLPDEVVQQTSARYREIAERILGKELPA